ncbi:Fibronectin type III [Candidatus Nanopelagicaceae bacterium]
MFRRGVRNKLTLPTLSVAVVALSLLSPVGLPQASAKPALVTCVNLVTEKERVSRTGECRIGREAQANWHKNPSDSARTTGANTKLISTCSEREDSPVTYRVIRKKCARNQVLTFYSRTGTLPAKPVIAEAVSYGHDSAALKLAKDPAESLDAPVAYYTITSNKGVTQKFYSWGDLRIAITGLQALTTYTFTVSATNVDGISEASIGSIPVTTSAYVPPKSNSTETIAAPAFTLSNNSETKVATIQIAGYTISSTGGAITSYALSGGTLPNGLTFSTSNGLITGTPIETKTATTYTITGTNAAGSASATFRLRVTGDLGDTGPGGGKIFYVASTPFACGPTRTSHCTYLEAARSGWNDALADPQAKWSNAYGVINNVGSPETATATAIGWGYRNTRAIILAGNTDTGTASALADSYAVTVEGVVVDDWYLPSLDELNEMYIRKTNIGGFDELDLYWSSTDSTSTNARRQRFNNTGENWTGSGKFSLHKVRPIRAF